MNETPRTAQKHEGTEFTTYIHDDSTGNHVSVFPEDESGHQIWIGRNEDDELLISIDDHANIVVEGNKKDKPTLRIQDDEYPTEIVVEDNEYRFTDIKVDDGT